MQVCRLEHRLRLLWRPGPRRIRSTGELAYHRTNNVLAEGLGLHRFHSSVNRPNTLLYGFRQVSSSAGWGVAESGEGLARHNDCVLVSGAGVGEGESACRTSSPILLSSASPVLS